MKLTRSVSYAVSILLRVHESRSRGPVTAARIAHKADFPPRFLYRVLRRLVDAGLLHGTSGPGGGYSLARSAAQISLADIVLAVEGKVDNAPLEAVARGHSKAIRKINALTKQQTERCLKEMQRVKLSQLLRAK